MSELQKKFISRIEIWLDRANSNKYLNIGLMGIIIVSVLIFFLSTFPDSLKRVQILIVPIIAGLNVYFLGSKNHIVRETANFIAGLLFVGFVFFSIALIFMGLVILKSL